MKILLLLGFWMIFLGFDVVLADDRGNASRPAAKADSPRYFETKIAPLLAKHCIDCHDSATKDGDLDLTLKSAALSGGESGKSIIPGKSGESLLWEYVESDEMPQNRAPLTAAEKDVLRKWIDAGAVWSLEKIEPEAYIHDGRGAETWLQRLTVSEYIETVRSAVDVDIEVEARRMLPRDERADGFSNTAYNLGVDLAHIEGYSRLARLIVGQMDMKAFAAQHANCDSQDEKCMRDVISRIGKHLLRGPLGKEEVAVYLKVSDTIAEEGGDFHESVGFVVQAMLQSPRFIYRIERQQGDGSNQAADNYELASRMSYMLWGGPPDEELMKAADAGKLHDVAEVESQTNRMLKDPRAVTRSLQFISEWIDLNRLETLRPNPNRFPQWNNQLAADMRDETLSYFEEVVWQRELPLWKLMNAPFTYATPRLAHHYGLYEKTKGEKEGQTPRVRQGLQALYTFQERGGDKVRDVSETGDSIDLKIADPSRVRWQPDGIVLDSSTVITAEQPPAKLIEAIKKSKAITLEAWVTPANTTQAGPARIVTLSNGIGARNFTLGQSGDRFEVRLRTTKTSGNGEPSLSSVSGTVNTSPQHVVYTRDSSGNAVIFVDGQEVGNQKLEGDFSNWDSRFHLAVGNELSGDRLWQGTLHLVAIYDRALSVDDVRQNHAAGGTVVDDQLAALAVSASWLESNKKDLVALYRFNEGKGDTIRDQAKVAEALDLKIDKTEATKWSSGGLTVYGSPLIATAKPPKRLIDTIKKTKALSLEAWVTPLNTTQDGPARIVTLSSGTSERNVTLGQDGVRYDARLRAGRTDGNGLPALSSASGSVEAGLTHLVFTKDASGRANLYVNGEEQATSNVGEELSKWSDGYRLMIANESTKDRPWQGTYHLLAIYSRALEPEEIRAKGAGITRYDLAEVPSRGGLLTQGSVLTIGGDEASMVARGLFVLHDLLYSRVGNPPACVDTTPIPAKPGMSMRGLAEVRLANSSCVGCHERFEPLAFGLEKFDGIGAYHEIDEFGNKLREDGDIRFPGQRQAIAYETSAELMDLLAESDRVRMAITRKVTQFALGRPLVAADMPHLEKIRATAQEKGGTYPALMTAILTSDLVRMTRTEAR